VVAGRAAARGITQLSMLVLLPAWGAASFGAFAAAIGTFTWLWMLTNGAEKAALTVLPRTSALASQYTRMLLARAVVPLCAATLAAVALAPAGGLPALYAAAAVYAAGQGLLQVLASLHRLEGRADRDGAAYLALAAWVAGTTALAVAGVLAPYAYLLAVTAGVLVACAVLARLVPALRARPPRVRAGSRAGLLIGRRVVLLGLSDVADSASVATLYIVLAATGEPADSALVFVVLLVSGVLGSLGVLVLRLAQPATSMRLRGPAGRVGRRRARRLAGIAALVTAAGGVVGASGLLPAAVALGVVAGVEIVAFVLVLYAVYLMENTTGAILSATTSAAALGLVATALVAVFAVPALGALGAVLALVAGLCAKAAALYLRPLPPP
jgi:hypothetical protein